MTVVSQYTSLRQVVLLLVMAHIDHDGVKWKVVGDVLDLLVVLRVVQVNGNRNRCPLGGSGCRED